MTLPQSPTSADRSAFAWLRRIVLEIIVPLYGIFEYSVVSASLGTGIEATATDPSLPIPSQVHIPIRSGIAGASTVPSTGSLCYVSFANGDRSKPIVHAFDDKAAQSLELSAAAVLIGTSATQDASLGTVVSTQLASVKTVVDAVAADLVTVFTATSLGAPTTSALMAAFNIAMGVTNKSATVKVSP